MSEPLNPTVPTRFIFPVDGDYVNDRDGVANDGYLRITAAVAASPGCLVTINGIYAEEKNGVYSASLQVAAGCTVLSAQNTTDGTGAVIRICYSPKSIGKYRISSDDNILFLADITANQDTYTSIFDNPYLAVYKKAHDLYDAKIHLNLFYAFDRAAAAFFRSNRPDFDLSMMTDKFKAEWEANSDWLKLSFHARQEHPDKPYLHASPDTIIADFLDVQREVLRFAGEKTFANDVTTIHWGEANPLCVGALRKLGHRSLMGYFEINKEGTPHVAYYVPAPLTEHIGQRDFWHDTEMGITFGRIDRVTNNGSLETVMRDIDSIVAHPHRGGFVSFMIHEQYFYEDYRRHLPDFEKRILEPAKFLWEKGYHGSFVSEVLRLAPAL